ncbi:hypothetical protein GRS48_01260 [Halorubrum sp. JWXQ-INN 858]|uniref:hypothetical protein n=1 Tax=Halorubrum sp. JWXQ-INN 858 TaxID=2690782 RepID=UPI00135AA291|nr:hypothetical protein [Halorubrum sp. JWXQ-INN 858]MWV63461.1 hypothetical protein [Halorubrum sp. JWXQ-INN 858]
MEKQNENDGAKGIEEEPGVDPIILAAIASVALSWYQFYVRGNKKYGLFVGLWPPTLLAFSSALRINEISRKLDIEEPSLLDRLM